MIEVVVKCMYNTQRICAEEISFRIDSLEPEYVEMTERIERGPIGIARFVVRYNPAVMDADDIVSVLSGDVNKVSIKAREE